MPTRPTTGPEGLLLDLDRRVTSTEREGLWTIPWGVVALAQSTTAPALSAAFRVMISATFVAVPGRYYDLRVMGRVAYGGGGEAIGTLRIGTTDLGRWWEQVANSVGHIRADSGLLWTPTSSTTQTVTLDAAIEGSGMTVSLQGFAGIPVQLSVRDVGPAI